jgi:phage tail P2-like protein
MNSAYGITAENLLRVLPEVLQKNSEMYALATGIAQQLSTRLSEINMARIYTRIGALPEELLDILAYDLKVDWYDYNYGIKAKRALLQDSFYVHRHLGTRGAVERALSDIYPGTEIQEWFEYGGEPFYFRVILDVTNQRVSITQSQIVRAINTYKSLRSHLEDEATVYRSRIHIGIGVSSGYVAYFVRPCGSFPARATQGEIAEGDIAILTDSDGAAYAVPKSGMTAVGAYPTTSTQGSVETGDVSIGANGGGVAYISRYCGSVPGSII